MLLWSIGVAAVIRARGKVRAISEQARGAGWVSPFMPWQTRILSHVKPHVAAAWF